MSIHGVLLSIVLVWWAIVDLTLTTPFGIFVFITGIVWGVVSIGVHSGTVNRP